MNRHLHFVFEDVRKIWQVETVGRFSKYVRWNSDVPSIRG